MRVAVTGGSGKLGRAVVSELLDNDYEVVNLDRVPSKDPRAAFTRIDFTDFGETVQALTAIDSRYEHLDGIVHLAAIPGPGMAPNATILANNVISSYNVFAAAHAAHIKTIVWASSETLLGLPFDVPPPYIPVDEDYPVRPQSTYALGKALDEEMARHFCRWDPELKMIGLRFSNVMEPADYAMFPTFDADASLRRWNLWSYIDARDGAQAVRRALEHEATGMDVFIIANADTVMSRPNDALIAETFPGVTLKRPVKSNETVSIRSIAGATRRQPGEPPDRRSPGRTALIALRQPPIAPTEPCSLVALIEPFTGPRYLDGVRATTEPLLAAWTPVRSQRERPASERDRRLLRWRRTRPRARTERPGHDRHGHAAASVRSPGDRDADDAS